MQTEMARKAELRATEEKTKAESAKEMAEHAEKQATEEKEKSENANQLVTVLLVVVSVLGAGIMVFSFREFLKLRRRNRLMQKYYDKAKEEEARSNMEALSEDYRTCTSRLSDTHMKSY